MESISQLNCVWSAPQRHSDIAINGGSISRTAITNRDSHDNYWPVCCLGGEMGDSDGGLRRWSVRIAKMHFGMGIGMCQIRQAQSHKFEMWNWRNIGHGHYCVASHGYVYSHSDASANFKQLSFEFGMGDVLRFEYDPKQGKLKVQNQKGGRCELSVERKGEKYAVCAYLINIGDAAELMDS
jgi:hypothetical protein